jgi:polyferredoxin
MEKENGKFRIWNREFDISPCSIRQDLCEGCGECAKACPLDIPKLTSLKTGVSVSHIDPLTCTGCGICAGGCAAGAIQQEAFPHDQLSGMGLDPDNLKGKTVVFACSRSALPEATEGVVQVPCIGRVSVENMLECLARGADGILLMCRDQATCPTGRGGALGAERIKAADALAVSARLGHDRIKYVKPRPGPGGPEDALAEFKATLLPSPLVETYKRSDESLTGMDHILEIRRWLKGRPELAEPELQPLHTGFALPLVGSLGKRRIIQSISLIFLHSSFWNWAQVKWLCNPVLSCHSCPLAIFACPVGVFVHYSGYHVIPYLAVGTVLFLGVLFGRLLCGWVCPFGFLQDLLYKIPTVKFVLWDWTRFVKYGVLIVMVFLLPFFLGELTYLSFCRICPAAALQSTLPRMIDTGVDVLQTAVVVKLGLLVFFLVLSTLSNRAFCKVFCPIGAMLAPLNLISFWKIKPSTMTCVKCSWCDNKCPPNGAPSSRISEEVPPNRVMDCVYCYECKQACPMGEEVGVKGQCHVKRA